MKHDMFYAKPRCKKTPKGQLLSGRWRTTTNLYVDGYKFAAIPKFLYNKQNLNEIPFILRKRKKQGDTVIPSTA